MKKRSQKQNPPPKTKKNRETKKRGWRDVFDECTYSSGPGDNIYVYG